ncbi:hypothetical protein CKO24_10260 [Rhodothalassium salexigens DSM 2132]|nr:hypothetical protein [Rhodothalassium salexigens DSM 2132]
MPAQIVALAGQPIPLGAHAVALGLQARRRRLQLVDPGAQAGLAGQPLGGRLDQPFQSRQRGAQPVGRRAEAFNVFVRHPHTLKQT